MKKITLLIFLCSLFVNAQQSKEEQAIKNTIKTFFDGLHKGDSTLMATTLHSSIKIQSTATNRQGKAVLNNQTRTQLLTAIANKNPNATYLEKILSYTIKIDGNLASVWTPYEFYFNGKFSHCGANSFQFYKENGNWKIIYLVDMRRRNGCNPSQKDE